MIFNLVANIPALIGHYDGVVAINVKQIGAGNLRLGTDRESLLQGTSLAPGQVVDGITQAAADGVKTWFWSGDLYLISDVTGPCMVLAPAYAQYVDRLRGNTGIPSDRPIISEEEGNLSTYSG